MIGFCLDLFHYQIGSVNSCRNIFAFIFFQGFEFLVFTSRRTVPPVFFKNLRFNRGCDLSGQKPNAEPSNIILQSIQTAYRID